MAAAGGVALPSRDYQATGPYYEWVPHSALGGQRGSVEAPDRLSVFEGYGIPAGQPPEPAYPNPFGLVIHYAISLYELVCEGGLSLALGQNQGHAGLAAMGALGIPTWFRRRIPNISGPSERIPPPDARTDWSANAVGAREETLVPSTPIRMDSRQWAWSFKLGFDQRIQADYVPHRASQKSLIQTRNAMGTPQPLGLMLEPFFPRLTMLNTTAGSFGSSTPVVTPTLAGEEMSPAF